MRLYCYSVIFILLTISSSAQETEVKPTSFDFNYFYGSIARHNKDVASLITGHPEGFVASYNRKTYGFNDWERRYNYPDWGFTFAYQNLKNDNLGDTYNLYGHYSFYFFKRKLMFKIGQGIGYSTNPFDIQDNIENNAYGTRLFSSTLIVANYQQAITPRVGVQAGFTLLHGSNGNLKAPNTSTNTIALNFGVYYRDATQIPEYIPKTIGEKYTEPIHLNIKLSGGLNESDYLNLGQHPFLVVSAYADKRLNRKSTLVLGAEAFFSRFLKEEIRFLSIAFPTFGITEDQDWKRVGIFVGHELQFGRIALLTHVGFYAYYPYDFEGRLYERVGLKRTFGENIFGSVAVKVHGAKAEAIEFGIGYRL